MDRKALVAADSGRILDHVGIAVPSLLEALPLWESIVGLPGTGHERIDSQGVEVVFVGTGAGRVELLAPTAPDSPVARFLDRRGPGMHHLCYRVEDLAAALDQHRRAGLHLIDEHPRRGAQGHLVAFLHPRSTGGVLIELVQLVEQGRGKREERREGRTEGTGNREQGTGNRE